MSRIATAEQFPGRLPIWPFLARGGKVRLTPGPVLHGLLVGVFVALAGIVFWLTPLHAPLEETVGLDWLFSVRGPIEAPDDVAVVSIDRRSAIALGYDPRLAIWPREVHARLIRVLDAAGAKAIAFDIIFEDARNRKTDAELAAAIAASGRVVLFERLERFYEPFADGGASPGGGRDTHDLEPPLEPFARGAAGLAPFPLPKVPARVGQVWTFKTAAGGVPTLPVVALQVALVEDYPLWRSLLERAGAPGAGRLPATIAGADAGALRALMIETRDMFTRDPDLVGRVNRELASLSVHLSEPEQRSLRALAAAYAGGSSRYVNYYGPAGTVRTLPIAALIAGDAGGPRERGLDLDGRTVFVGASELFDPDQRDGFHTVFTRADGVDLSGVESAATAHANLLEDRWSRLPPPTLAIAMLAAFGIAAGLVVFLAPPLYGVSACLALAGGYAAAGHALFRTAEVWLPVMTTLLVQAPIALILGLLGRYLLLRHRWQRYIVEFVPKHIASQFELETYRPGADDREVEAVCLATDVAKYARFAELCGPTQGQRILNALLQQIIHAFEPHEADICEISIDGLMATWTIVPPGTALDARRRACLGAIDALAAAERFNRESPQGTRLPIRIGLNIGTAFVGNVGPDGRLIYGTRGDTPITASRLEALNKTLGTRILASALVVEDVDDVLVRPIGEGVLVGKRRPIPVVEILCRSGETTAGQRALCERFASALAEIRKKRLASARSMLVELRRDYPEDGPTRFLLDDWWPPDGPPETLDGAPLFRMERK